MEKEINALREIIKNSDNIVFFGGAGVSTESGIPDFRSVDGLYNQKYKFPPEEILSHDFFNKNTLDFYEFYRDKITSKKAEPNKAHLALAKLEKENKLKAVITQNIDGLHQMAGSKNVLELHGSVHRNYCTKCRKPHGIESIGNDGIPVCVCGGIIKPDVVLYGESLNQDVMSSTVGYISKADVLIVGGTSLTVYPAVGFINYFSGSKFVIINNSETTFDSRTDLIIRGKIGEVLEQACNAL